MVKRLFLIGLIAICYSTLGLAQLHTFRNYNHRDGLHMAATTDVAQTDDGYLWIASEGGPLIRFNGTEFKEIHVPDADNNFHIDELCISSDTLYFASRWKGFLSYTPKNKSYTLYTIKLKDAGEALALVKHEQSLYFIGTHGIFLKEGDKYIPMLKHPINKGPLELHQYIVYHGGVILLTNHGNYHLKNNKLTVLNRFLGISPEESKEFTFGYYSDQTLNLINKSGSKWLRARLNEEGKPLSSKIITIQGVSENEQVIDLSHQPTLNKTVVLSNNGSIYQFRNNKMEKIAHNFNAPINSPKKILCDLNGDMWVSSEQKGLYKISLEPFTKLQLDPKFETHDICLPFRTMYNDIFISRFSGKSYVGNFSSLNWKEYDFIMRAVAQSNGSYYVATNIGIKKFVPGADSHFEDLYFKNENVVSLLFDKGYLWAGVAGKGIIRIDIKTGEQKQYSKVPEYFYTGQISQNGKQIYFGTNDGIFIYERSKDAFERLKTSKKLGSYSGVSTKDVYGNIWFSLEKGIIGIINNSRITVLKGEEHFGTNLFYTLNSDRLGNLVVGTNKGVTIVKVNKSGEVKGVMQYDSRSGFEGYETHMRSQFQSGNDIYVGTVEGLFLINTDILEQIRIPLPPVIANLSNYDMNGMEQKNVFHFQLQVNNPKSGTIKYSYRLSGKSNEWIPVNKDGIIHLYNLRNGNYTLEARATYDGERYSDISTYKFSVELPIWQTNWFIILIVICVIGVNLLLINYSRAFERNTLIKTKDMEVHIRLTPNIILFGIIAVVASHTASPFLSGELALNLGPVLAVGFALLVLYFMAKSVLKTENEYLLNRFLLIAVGIVMLHFYYELYRSGIHPFHIIGLVLTTMVVPYFLSGIKQMITFTSLIFLGTIIVIITVSDSVYPKSYFLIANIVLICLLILSSFLRSDSLERLIFISGIVNKGNIPAIAFSRDGKIVYVSENISKFVGSTHEKLVNQDISVLNKFVPFDGIFKEVDVVKDFQDGKKYTVPMEDSTGEIHWVEWEYKDFSKDVKVMVGQDVTEKLELENTYELLVQNAEDFIFSCDINGNFLFVNNIFYEKLGYSPEDILNQPANKLVTEECKEEVGQFYRDHFEQRKNSSYYEFPVEKKNGEILWVGQYVTTLYVTGSKMMIKGFIALARDITEIRYQQKLIKDQRDSITSSINYAQRIQFNLLPHERNFTTSFKEHFILYKPKDIVSGDFYWIEKTANSTILALADCTGHGVPGSFMTLLGINLLNTIVRENNITDPGAILNELDKRLVDTLPRQKGANTIRDGMEISICVIDDNSNELAYACAGSRFLIFNDGEFIMLKGDNKHIGDDDTPDFTGFNTHYTNFSSSDQLYLFTDGFQDQFGGKRDKKFSFRRILQMFESVVDLPLREQKQEITTIFEDWIGQREQTDDLTIISIKKNVV